MKRLRRLSLLLLWVVTPVWGQGPDMGAWHRLVGILQYLEADYPGAIASQDAFELEEQRSFITEAVAVSRELGPRGAPFVARLEALQRDVLEGKNPEGVSAECGQLVVDLTQAGGLVRSPRRAPDLERGEKLFAESCASCHGAQGDGNSPLAPTMKPPPASFHHPDIMSGLTPYKAFNTVTFGVTGTAMPGFKTLSEDDRWSLAFFLFSLRQPPCDGPPNTLTMEELATSTDSDLGARHGEGRLSCLRRQMPKLNENQNLHSAYEQIEKAVELASQGQFALAQQAVLDGYLNGLEPIEPLLRARNPKLVDRLEHGFFAVRIAAGAERADTADQARALLALLEEARQTEGRSDVMAVFFAALLILLREGFEAIVVVGALLAVLKKMEATQHARMVHVGWFSALVVGALLFVLGRKVLGGAQREWLEGLVALAAVAMLVYAAVWLNSRANTRAFMGELRGQMQQALSRGSVAGLFLISFSAALRESFETALFLQGLATDSVTGTVWGALAGLGALLLLVLLINRVGFKLPMKQLFSVSTAVLLGTAVVMLGKGLRALQEVDALPLRPLPLFTVDVLGLYPDLFTLLPQLVLTCALVLWKLRERRKSRLADAINSSRAAAT